MNFGLVGKDIEYSFSKSYFTTKFSSLGISSTYENYDIQNTTELHTFLENSQLNGFNVTIPYKEEIIELLDELDTVASGILAVNCVKIDNNKRIGYNTDVFGFEGSLLPLLKPSDQSALIFGDGGSAKAIKYVLEKLNINFETVSRKGELKYEDLSESIINRFDVLINTTPLGTFPKTNSMIPIDSSFIKPKHLVYDLIYNPEKTKLLQVAEKQGARIKNGYEMLLLQAEKSYEIWIS